MIDISIKAIKEHTGYSKYAQECDLAFRETIIWSEFEKFLGLDFLDHLNSKLTDTSSAKEYNRHKSYLKGDMVVYRGTFYEAVIDTNGEPDLSDDWHLVKKFTSICLNTLWCEYLEPYLAVAIVRKSLYDTGKEDQILKARSLDGKVKTRFEMLDYYMKKNNQKGCFDSYKGVMNCSTNKKSKTRFFIC